MGYNLTVEEAAERLGVSKGRIYQLIDAGRLTAEKFGHAWMVDEASVASRAKSVHHAGRPSRSSIEGIKSYTLMNREHEVLTFECVPNSAIFTTIHEIIDGERAPLGVVSPRAKSASVEALSFWWVHRAIPGSRKGLDARLRELGVDASALPFGSLGLSLSDQYWVRPANADIDWHDVNYFENNFDLGEGGWLASVGLSSPDNTSEGELSKKWIIKDGERVLLKGAGPFGQEPLNEVLATKLHSVLLKEGDFVPYWTEKIPSGIASACSCFLSDTEEYIPAFYVRQTKRKPNHLSEYRHFIECCVAFGIEDAELQLSKMIACDDIIANYDRHWRNFGIIRNVETLQCRMAPIFDSGSSLWCNQSTEKLAQGYYRFSSKPFHEEPNRQLMLVDDFSWLDVRKLEGFSAEVAKTLASNPATADRADYVADAVSWRINRISTLLA